MARYNKQNIDRKTNKPNPSTTEGLDPDRILNRAEQTRRDDDVIRTKNRTLYDIDFAIKWYIDNEIQPQIQEREELISVPVIYANGEKWDNARKLGYIRDEKGMIQCPVIMLKRTSVVERDNFKGLDVNRMPGSNFVTVKQKYNPKNRYEDELVPIPNQIPASREIVYVIDIPKYVTLEYEMLIWCDFTTQLNDLIDQILPYGRYAWGNEGNRFETSIGSISFETVNTTGEDRVVRATVPLTVQGALLSEQESRISTIKKRYSIKKVSFDTILDLPDDLFESTTVPLALRTASQQIFSGATMLVTGQGGNNVTIDSSAMAYIINMRDEIATYVNTTTVTVAVSAAINPITLSPATVNEFDVYINGQYIDKAVYNWIPSTTPLQTIVFDATILGYDIQSDYIVVINGRWA